MKKRIFFLSLFLVIAIIFTGCSEKGKPTKIVSQFLDAYKSKDYKVSEGFIKNKEFIKDNQNFPKELRPKMEDKFSQIEYKILSEDIKENKAKVKVEIKFNEMGKVLAGALTEYMQEAFTSQLSGGTQKDIEKILNEKMLKALEKNDIKRIKKTIEINLSKEKDQWKIEASEDLENALFGNLIEFGKKMQSSFEQK